MRGLSFSEPMVKAWLSGTKTLTRRLMNPQPLKRSEYGGMNMYGQAIFYPPDDLENMDDSGLRKPKYLPGECIYIKETWILYQSPNVSPVDEPVVLYKADDFAGHINKGWKSPRFMPEWAARSHALIVSIRPERVQEITEEEAKREGVTPFRNDPEGDCWTDGKYRTAFEYLWNELHGWDPNNFQENPWVWRIELEKK